MDTSHKPGHIKFILRTFTDAEIEALLTAAPNFRRMDLAHRDGILRSMENGWWNPCTGETLR